MEKEIRLIRRGIPRQEYIEYFRAIGKEVEPDHFVGENWEVIVGEEREAKILKWSVAETEIICRGEEEQVKKLADSFRLKFLRAGG